MQSRSMMYARHPQLPLQWFLFLLPPVGLRYWHSIYFDRPISFPPSQIPTVADPRSLDRHPFLVFPDLVLNLHREANVIQSVNQAMLPEFLNLEVRQYLSVFVSNFLSRKVDLDFPTSLGFVSDLLDDGLIRNGDWEHSILKRVIEKDVGVAGCYNSSDSKI